MIFQLSKIARIRKFAVHIRTLRGDRIIQDFTPEPGMIISIERILLLRWLQTEKFSYFCATNKLTSPSMLVVRSGRDVRVVEGARLESACTPKGYRGFESHSLRNKAWLWGIYKYCAPYYAPKSIIRCVFYSSHIGSDIMRKEDSKLGRRQLLISSSFI